MHSEIGIRNGQVCEPVVMARRSILVPKDDRGRSGCRHPTCFRKTHADACTSEAARQRGRRTGYFDSPSPQQKTGASVETDPSIRPESQAGRSCRTNRRRRARSSPSRIFRRQFCSASCMARFFVTPFFFSQVFIEELPDVYVVRSARRLAHRPARLDFDCAGLFAHRVHAKRAHQPYRRATYEAPHILSPN